MRNLKKVLALVLAMAMALSLAVTAGAAFTDQDAVNYDVAVDTMVELGVINGYTDGSFKPANTVTRAEAAKMIAYTVAGADEATINYYAGSSKFEDVVGSYAWASGAVNYCAGKDIIAGRSETVFDPGATVTGAELAKMILVALGYEPDTANKAETLVGANWQTNAISMALKLDLFEGLNEDFVATQAANREETAQILYNALSANIKEVAFVLDGYYVYKDVMIDNVPVSLLEDAFDAEASTNEPGDFGRPATTYTFDDADIDPIVITEYADFEFTGEVDEKDVFKAIGAEGVKNTEAGNKFITMTKVYVDGAEQEDVTVVVDNDVAENTDYFGWGTTVEVYETDTKNEYTMVVINEYIGEVSKVKAADEDAGTERTITIGSVGTFETEDFAKKDVVLYTIDGAEIASVKLATAVEGEITKVTNGNTFTIDGVNYKVSAKHAFVTEGADADYPALDASGSWYVDSMGNLMMVKDADDAEVFYGFLLSYEANDGEAAGLLGNGGVNAGEKFEFVDETGKVVVLDGAYETNDDGDIEKFVASALGETASISETTWNGNPDDDIADTANIMFSYELNSKGEISKVYNDYGRGIGGSAPITKGNAVITANGKFGTDETLYFYIDKAEEEYAVYTGYANAPTKETAKIAGWFIDDDGKTVEAIALYVSDIAGQTEDDYVFFASNENTVVTEGDDTITTFTDVYVNGVAGSIKFEGDASTWDVAGELYTFTTSTKTECATLTSEDLLTMEDEVTTIASTYFKAAGTFYYVDSDTVYYEINEDGDAIAKVDALEALSTNDAYIVNILYVDDVTTDKDNAAGVVVFQVVYDYEESAE